MSIMGCGPTKSPPRLLVYGEKMTFNNVVLSLKKGVASSDHDSLYAHPYPCPFCGADTVHPDDIEIRKRDRWGAATSVTIHGNDVHVDHAGDPTWTGRSSHIKIAFWCEVCGKTHGLTFTHHKGQTFTTTQCPGAPCHGA